MFIYLFVVFLLCFFIYKYDFKGETTGRTKCEKLLIVFLICIVGFRYQIGSDTVKYEWTMRTVDTPYLNELFSDWRSLSQPLWMFVMSFSKTIFNSFVPVQFFHAIIFQVCSFYYIKKMTSHTFTAILLLFATLWFTISFEVLRESISVAIYLCALLHLKEKKYLRYFLLAIIASGFHVFAFIIFVLTPLVNFTPEKFLFLALACAVFLVPFIDASFFNNLIVSIQLLFGDSDVAEKMNGYIGNDVLGSMSLLGIIRYVLLGYFLPLYVVLHSEREYSIERKLVLLSLIISTLGMKIAILYRLSNYLNIIYIVILTNILYSESLSRTKIKPVIVFLSVISIIMGFVDVYRPDPDFDTRPNAKYDIRYFPYTSIFQNPNPTRESFSFYQYYNN